MTRYARAKGSKSSNEKVPEKATPWLEMKTSMLKKQEEPSEATKKCLSILKSKTQQSTSSQWVSLDNDNEDSLNILKQHLQKRREKEKESHTDSSVADVNVRKRKHVDSELYAQDKKKKKKKKKPKLGTEVTKEESAVDSSVNKIGKGNEVFEESVQKKCGNLKPGKIGKKKIIKKKKEIVVKSSSSEITSTVSEGNQGTVCEVKSTESGGAKKKNSSKSSKLKKAGKINGEATVEPNTPEDAGESQNTEGDDSKKTLKKMKSFAAARNAAKGRNLKKPRNFNSKNDNSKLKSKFIVDVNIGGETVTLMKFQGFHIKKEDVKRLKELKRKMVEEGIPKSQIESALRLERRRCEKGLARMRKNVCFHCRKPGHVLSQCPDKSENVDTSTGVCYKCGSTEHTAFSCKVSHGKSYPFAECFICKEKGHIARECPDNPRGLYPKGGACKICGDVTHLKKDCPKRQAETGEKAMTVSVRNDRDLEGLEDDLRPTESNADESPKQKKKKAVVF